MKQLAARAVRVAGDGGARLSAELQRESGGEKRPGGGWLRAILALIIGLTGAAVIWVAAPFNDELIGSSSLTDTYLPPGVLFIVLILVLAVNPLLRKMFPALALTKRQLTLAMGIMLVACCLPGQGLLKSLPYSIVSVPRDVSEGPPKLSDVYKRMDLPETLFPAKLERGKKAPVSEHFIFKLPEGEAVPWRAWLGPLISWGGLLIAAWLMMIGMALIVLPQWRNNERLAFPLLEVCNSLTESPEEGRLIPPLLRRGAFWAAMLTVFGLYFLVGLKQYYPGEVPAIPLEWDLYELFREGILRYTPWYIWYSHLYFIFIGVTFFMPSRIGFSVWFFEVAYAVHWVVQAEYNPPVYWDTVVDHRMGAMWALAAVVLWLGRRHWAHVFRCIFVANTEEENRNRVAGLMFLTGVAGMFVWLWLFVNVPLHWAVFFVAFGFTVSLVVTRIVAETGMAFIRMHFNYWISFIHLAPMKIVTLPVIFIGRFISMIFPIGSRVSVATMATHAIGLDRDASPGSQWRTGMLLLVVLVIGLVICGGAHLWMNYHYDESIDGLRRPLNGWGLGHSADAAQQAVKFNEGRAQKRSYNQLAHTGFGAAGAGALYMACLATPRWPLHPIGLVMANSFYSMYIWFSVFVGWLAKVLILRYGGAQLYKKARVFFIGLILGEVFAAIFWALVPAILALVFGATDYKVLRVQP